MRRMIPLAVQLNLIKKVWSLLNSIIKVIKRTSRINRLLVESGGYIHVKFYKAKLKKSAFGLKSEAI